MPITSPFTFPKGVNTVTCTASNGLGTATCSFNVTVEDREAPIAALRPGPRFGTLDLLSTDNCDPNPQIFVRDSASTFVAGPFASGDVVKILVNPRWTPEQKNSRGCVRIILKGPALFVAIDANGNSSEAGTARKLLKARWRGRASWRR
jgi:hypothetical protein